MSGGFFQGIDNLFQDIGAVICNLLEDGVGEFLQFRALVLALLQLSAQLERKKEVGVRMEATTLAQYQKCVP